MAVNQPLADKDLEAQAQALAQRIRKRADDDILALARLLVSKGDQDLFGDTEFQARDIVHHIGSTAFEERLKKTTATTDQASNAPPAGRTPSSTSTARKRP
jgi:hypothetical protein